MTTTELSPEVFQSATEYLASIDECWALHVQRVGPCQLRAKPARQPYEALIRSIAYQQLHAKAGDAILSRFLGLYSSSTFPCPEQVLATDAERLRACGFSAAKLATIRGVAQATVEEVVPPLAEALHLSDEALIERLVSLRGIGRWTVEMLLIYSLRRLDILPVDDLGVRDGYRRLKGLDTSPTPRQMREIGIAWSPHRTVASWYLWRCT
jgi:DNA-3-methyladenine glycosylase II